MITDLCIVKHLRVLYNLLVVLYTIRNRTPLCQHGRLFHIRLNQWWLQSKINVYWISFVWVVILYLIVGYCLWSWSSDGSWTSEESPGNVSVLSLPLHSLISVSPGHSLFVSLHAPLTQYTMPSCASKVGR